MANIAEYIKNPWRLWGMLAYRGFFDNLKDENYLKCMYKFQLNKKLNLKNPRSFNEKIQWLKLYDRRPEYVTMVDKYLVKEYIKDKIGKEYVVPTIGVWDRVEDIDFEMLPNQFVLKCNHNSGLGMYICKNKSQMNENSVREKLTVGLKQNYYKRNREWPYKDVKPKIIAEKYLCDSQQCDGLLDYKFYCFYGVPKYLYVSMGLENEETAQISFLNLDWSFAAFGRSDYRPLDELPQKPKCYDEMIQIARTLSEGIPFLRVDLYEVNGQVYFSELTFSPCSGMMPFDPPEADYEVGKLLQLPEL